jgi:hypothetical protein
LDERRFDSLVKTLTAGGSRRGILQFLGASALASALGRFAAGEDVAARKKRKKKKCKGNTTKCGKKACCRADQNCENGTCVDKAGVLECRVDADCRGLEETCQNGQCVPRAACQNAGDCAANQFCIAGECICGVPNKICGAECCLENQVCLNGECVVGQGTCPATDEVCISGVEVACNDDDDCFCGQRADGDVRCIGGFFDDSRDNCICIDDADCERDFGAGAICIKGGPACQCQDTDSGRCALLCPSQIGN